MSGSSLLNAVNLLESYRGRDKIMRTACFVACMGSGMTKNEELSQKLLKVMTEISACRTILRLFDDLSMLAKTATYGFGKNEKDIIQRFFNVISNLINQMFFPVEHIAWAADKGLISINAAPWWFASLLTWISSLIVGIMSCLWRLGKLQQKTNSLRRQGRHADGDEAKVMMRMKTLELLTLTENASNLTMAIHWLPGGRLWSGKLSRTTVGFLGVLSSFIGIMKMTSFKG